MKRVEWLKDQERTIDNLSLDDQLEQQEFKNLVKGYLHTMVSLLDFMEEHQVITDESPEFALTQGNYKGGVDIPCGFFDLEAVALERGEYGMATVRAKKPNDDYIFLKVNSDDSQTKFINFEITDKSYVKITTTNVKVVFKKHLAMM